MSSAPTVVAVLAVAEDTSSDGVSPLMLVLFGAFLVLAAVRWWSQRDR